MQPDADITMVPISLWCIPDPDPWRDPDISTGGSSARLAAMLVAMYADAGDTIVVIGDDPTVAGATGAAGCRYHHVERLTDLAGLEHLGHRVGILITTWPQPAPGRLPGDAAILFATGEHLVARHGSAIVTLPIRPTEDSYGTYGWRLLTEAQYAGFQLHAHIVVVLDDPVAVGDLPIDLLPHRHVLVFVPPGAGPRGPSPQTHHRRTVRTSRSTRTGKDPR
ncbi:hypothetical protein [Dactylosporangium cerinum]